MPVTPVLFLQLYASLGGAENALLHLLAGLDRTRWRPLVVVGRDGPLVEAVRALGIDVVVIPFPAPPLSHLAFPGVVWALIRAAFRIRSLVRETGVRILQTGDVLGLLLAVPSGRRVPVVYQANYIGGWARRSVAGAVARLAAHRVVAFTEDHRRRLGGLASRTVVIAPGVDTAAEPRSRAVACAALELDPGRPIVGMVARFDVGKGHDVFLRAVACLLRDGVDVQAVLVGGDLNEDLLPHVRAYREGVVAEARRLGLLGRVRFLGFVRDAAEAMAAMDVLVCPSDREPFGLVVVEAMALGVPVVVSDNGSPPEIVAHGRYGVTFPAGDDEALAKQLRDLLDDPERRRDLSRAGRERARTAYARDRYTRDVEALYESIV